MQLERLISTDILKTRVPSTSAPFEKASELQFGQLPTLENRNSLCSSE